MYACTMQGKKSIYSFDINKTRLISVWLRKHLKIDTIGISDTD